MELVRVSHDPARRKVIFSDVSKMPILTHELWQELLLLLGRSYQSIQARGGRLQPSGPIARVSPPRVDPHTIKPVQADIFRPVAQKKSKIETVLQNVLDGPIRPPPPAVMQAERAVLKAETSTMKGVARVQKGVLDKVGAFPVGGVLSAARGVKGMIWAKRSIEASIPDPIRLEWILDSKS